MNRETRDQPDDSARGPGRRSPRGAEAPDPGCTLEAESVTHQPSRLRIMAALVALPRGEAMDFGTLKGLLNLTDGNLSSHLSTLEQAGYVSVEKGYVSKRPRTWIWVTSKGREDFARYVAALERIIRSAGG